MSVENRKKRLCFKRNVSYTEQWMKSWTVTNIWEDKKIEIILDALIIWAFYI